jgi:hypothetical protein
MVCLIPCLDPVTVATPLELDCVDAIFFVLGEIAHAGAFEFYSIFIVLLGQGCLFQRTLHESH